MDSLRKISVRTVSPSGGDINCAVAAPVIWFAKPAPAMWTVSW